MSFGEVIHINGLLWCTAGRYACGRRARRCTRFLGLSVVLQKTCGLLNGGQRVDYKTESGGGTVDFIAAPAETLVERHVSDGVVSGARVVAVRHLLEGDPPCARTITTPVRQM